MLKRFEHWYRNRLMMRDFSLIRSRIRPGISLLDVGCSTGDFLMICQNAGAKVKGIEFSPSAVEYCVKERKLDVAQGDLVTHDFGDERFDLITYNGVLEHVPNPFAHLRTCKRLLNPGGLVIVQGLPNLDSLGFRLKRQAWIGLDYPRHLHQFSIQSVRNLSKRAGYEIVSISTKSPRFNPPSLIASFFPSLHRHKFDEYEARTGVNPKFRKGVLLLLMEAIRPLDWLLAQLRYGEHINMTLRPIH
ncbi:ubiquinone/menaquinone biosynthesis methylase-like protein [Hylemonella gracilis ATCC 19624]|uniref:Ubiquinone/menaquinone biosynthesis methylase-like protein n=1 Tax=Hylemonella gracilis ATCC 19624 TaxID=887062 RepID=F3KSD6_9BURK|nr:ubiquinone/menaquinone biosynthesis methylase-like protein [Hylemonella gracilis ATCC 19624]